MTPFTRWVNFNLVGAMGMIVQLAALAFFNRLLHGRYLIASVAALEVTLLHNFLWHTQFTWRDRRNALSLRRQLVQFHLSSGLVSLIGNVVLMRLLVHAASLQVLIANAIAVLCCSLTNFWFSHRWAFSAQRHPLPKTQLSTRTSVACVLLALSLFELVTCSEAPAQLPDAPSSYPRGTVPANASTPLLNATHSNRSSVLASYAYYGAAFCGVGASTSESATVPAAGCGAGISFPIAPLFLEFGVMGPQVNRSYISAYLSANAKFAVAPSRAGYAPLVIIGYSRLFETGHALDYGIGLETPRSGRAKGDHSKALLLELRDYWTFANPSQHNVMLRIGWLVGIPD